MAGVILKAVFKTFGKTTAIKNFSLEIDDGEFVVLVGPSGCGKSTMLRLIAGLETASSGEIYIGDQLVNEVHPRDRDISMVFQNYALYPRMTVYENMSFSLRMRKIPKAEIERIVRQTADLLRIGQLLDRKPGQLSGGQRQRVALGRSIVRNPQVFLFDEPLSNLDAKLRIAMRAELLLLHQRLKTTIIYVTHDQLEAMTMGNRIVVMKDGLIQQVDAPDAVYDQPLNRFVAGFIGSPTMNFIDCRVVSEKGDLYATTPGIRLKIPESHARHAEKYIDQEAILGIRPEHLTVSTNNRHLDAADRFKAVVRVIENAGSEKLVHIRNENDTLVARLERHIRLKTEETVDFTARMDSAHLFDKQTEHTIF
ncbi:MAG: sn-glycerol-3-phosphate ABC transporter ATP-binding protein UgpC [Deltaproteobacteria bacterium]|nr:MAG: sn-glycerol-3-phosphate ABC transporter ATP-binding protein UgpC [Deltaproteobacteria bacterium]